MSDNSCYLTAHDDFSKKLLQKFPNPPQQVKLLLEKSYDLTLDQLDTINHQNDVDIAMLIFSLVFFRLKIECPIGIKAIKYIDMFTYMYKQNFAFKDSMFRFYSSTLSHEIMKCANIDELKQFMLKLQEIQREGIDISYFNSAIYPVFIKTMWDRIDDVSQPTDASKFIEYIDNLRLGKSIGLDIDIFISNMLGNTIRYIEDKNDIHGLKRMLGCPYEPDTQTAHFLLGHILTLNLPTGTLIDKINAIIGVIGAIGVIGPTTCDNVVNPHILDFSQLRYGSIIYVNSKNAKFHIEIYNASHPSVPKLAVKVYRAKQNPTDLDAINSEIQILKALSAKASPENCFLKYYGEFKHENSVYLVMEHADSDLMTKITEWKKLPNYQLPESKFKTMIYKLIKSFAEMEEMNINHLDIKPHNILVTNDLELKIIDFSISEVRDYENAYISSAVGESHSVQGTKGYMSPQLQYFYDKGIQNAVFSKGKADVFSLGLVILQMKNKEDLFTLNLEENHQRLMQKVYALKDEWLKSLLLKMLPLHPDARDRFRRLLQFIPGDYKTAFT